MAPMMFDEKPLTFDAILGRIEELEQAINLATRCVASKLIFFLISIPYKSSIN
jgi:hypothetical protein